MRQIYIRAAQIVLYRIQSCGKALQKISDQDTLVHWQNELNRALILKKRIESRIKVQSNVIFVDFKKRKVA